LNWRVVRPVPEPFEHREAGSIVTCKEQVTLAVSKEYQWVHWHVTLAWPIGSTLACLIGSTLASTLAVHRRYIGRYIGGTLAVY
jgi:hypothetical protein